MQSNTFSVDSPLNWLAQMADIFETQVIGNQIEIPEHLGHGTIKLYCFSPEMTLCVQQIYLNKPFGIARKAAPDKNILPIVFHYSKAGVDHIHLAAEEKRTLGRFSPQGIMIPAHEQDSAIQLPANEDIITIAVVVSRQWIIDYMQQISGAVAENLVNLFTCQKQFCIYESLTHAMEKIIEEVIDCNYAEPVARLLLQAKATELLALFFDKLAKREATQDFYNLNQADVASLFAVKKILMNNLDNPPTISWLAREVGMSESKLKKTFKQVFGHSVYQYALYNRMEKAKELLESQQYNVSEVGGLVGYSNLAHFAKAFKKQYSVAPKQYLQKLRG